MVSNAHSPNVSPSTHHSATWQSPVPYLFGGLAAMLGLIAFALLILACSYWKLSGYMDGNNNGESTNSQSVDLELGATDNSDEKQKKKVTLTYEKNILVIMAGQAIPTFLAHPSFVSNYGSNHGICDQVKMSTTETSENEDRVP